MKTQCILCLLAALLCARAADYATDIATVGQSQRQALEQAKQMLEEAGNPATRSSLQMAIKDMQQAEKALQTARNHPADLPAAVTAEQAAYQALLKLVPHEYRVSRSRRGSAGGAGQPGQRQMEQLEMTSEENRYETERQVAAAPTGQQREQLEAADRLKQLAQRQQDLNDRLRELQTALQQARTEKEQEEIRRELKHLADEERQMLNDVDDLRQKLEQAPNSSSLSQTARDLDQTRAETQRAAQELGHQSVSQALAAGARAQQSMQNVRENLRGQTSSQFSSQMRQLQNQARDLARQEDEIGRGLEAMDNAEHKKLDNSADRQPLVQQMARQQSALTNLLAGMQEVTEKAETTEPLLSEQLYDTLRRAGQMHTESLLQAGGELLDHGFLAKASEVEHSARTNINELRQRVEHAAESVLGSQSQTLRFAQNELNDLAQQVERGLGNATTNSTPSAGTPVNGGGSGDRLRELVQQGGGAGGGIGPILGDGFANWADRMRDVEQVVDSLELRNRLATVREHAAALRAEYRLHGSKPPAAAVRVQVLDPMAEVRRQLQEDLARLENARSLVPLDHDPVPDNYSELVRKYYREIGRRPVIVLAARDWTAPALALLICLAVALVWAGHRSAVERRIRLGCALLKLAGVFTLALCLLEPLRVGWRARPGANVFALMVDASQSLRVKDTGQTESRGFMLRRQLTNDTGGWQAALEAVFQVRRYTFDSHLQDVPDFAGLEFNGYATALEHALRAAVERWRNQPVAGVLLFTDGNATDSAGDLAALHDCPPVYPVIIGSEAGPRDIALDKVTVSQTAFEDAPVTVQAGVTARGFAGSDVSARLLEVTAGASNVVAQESKPARGEESGLNFRFQFLPDKPGLHFYQVETRAREEWGAPAAQTREATLANNRQIVAVDRGRESLRVLYVGGRPNWEFKFLNRALGEDPQVQMVSILRVAKREPKFDFKGREGESSNPLFRGFGKTDDETARYDQPVIIRLNTKDEFELRGGFPKTAAELFRYQAVIVGDAEADFFTHDQMVLLQRFVAERGGGFLMLGGAESFRQGNYAGTVIASLLPVYLDRPAAAKLPSGWKLNLTREGWLQPWTRLRATEADESSRLDSMPALNVFNAVPGVKPGASVLATVSDTDHNSFPALAAQRFGLGRSAALMIGDLWRWGMTDEAAQKDLAKSWRQLIRWLVSDVPARVVVTAQTAADGDPARVRLVVKVRDEEYKPLDNATVQLTIQPGSAHDLVLAADASASQPGAYQADYIATEPGACTVEAVAAQPDGKIIGRATAGWASDPAAAEFRALKPNRPYLEELARRTGGEVLTPDGLRDFVRRLPQRQAPIMEPWNKPLWQQPAVFLFAIGCFVAEWGIRRWKGLP